MRKLYAGIGSRKTPATVLSQMQLLARRLALRGYTLRSGAADGADSAFERGCDEVGGAKEIWLPWDGFRGRQDQGCFPVERHFEQASLVHPAWERLSTSVKGLHARNTGQVAGADLRTYVDFVLAWTPDGCESVKERSRETGGTGTAIAYADRLGIPVFNLAKTGSYERFVAYVLALERTFHEDGELPSKEGSIFVFGSNLAGRHGAGAALVAKNLFGASPGIGRGRAGQSYGIPTKAADLSVLGLNDIKKDVAAFVEYAKHNADTEFFVTRVGCGLAGYGDEQIAPLFAAAPLNCSFAKQWEPWLGVPKPVPFDKDAARLGINLFSGTRGLGGALTNMTVRAFEKGCLRHHYPVKVGEVEYPDAEAAYQAMKVAGAPDYNDRLMADVICLKFKQHPSLMDAVSEFGGVSWLERCSHITKATSEQAQSWEGVGRSSRFIRNLISGYDKALQGAADKTHVVHQAQAPFDVYIGRANGTLKASIWQNPFVIGQDGTRETVIKKYHEYLLATPDLLQKLPELKGKTLGCWCKARTSLTELCHGDVLASMADTGEWQPCSTMQAELF